MSLEQFIFPITYLMVTNILWNIYRILTEGSSEMIRTVLSANPTAKNLDLCSPEGTLAKAIQITSADISFLSVYSFN